MINVGLVGFGLSGRYLQAPYFEANPNFKLSKVVTSSSLTPTQVYPHVQTVHELDDVLNDATIQLVSITTPSHTHYEFAKRALLAGKHVLVEKPMTATLQEAEELFALAQQEGKVLCVYQNRRFDSDFQSVSKVIKQGWLGDVLNYEARFDRHKPILNPKKWKETPAPANGILYDLGSHIIDQVIALFGTPKSVTGEVWTQREGSEIDDAFDVRMDYGKLKVTLKSSLLVREPTPRYVIHGTKGSFVKYGIDLQEDHLKAGLRPGDEGFGKEPLSQWGLLNTELYGGDFRGYLEPETGNWGLLYDDLYQVITGQKDALQIQPAQILEQIKILEKITTHQ
ncbi:MAG: Gfo/Idh/MocA family oxidoreductase [Spirosomataceae bacterium]